MERLTRRYEYYDVVDLEAKPNTKCSTICDEMHDCESCPVNIALKKLADYEDKQEQGLIAQCTCKNCIHRDCADCSGDTIYCTELGTYRSINDSCNKAEAEEALAKMNKED